MSDAVDKSPDNLSDGSQNENVSAHKEPKKDLTSILDLAHNSHGTSDQFSNEQLPQGSDLVSQPSSVSSLDPPLVSSELIGLEGLHPTGEAENGKQGDSFLQNQESFHVESNEAADASVSNLGEQNIDSSFSGSLTAEETPQLSVDFPDSGSVSMPTTHSEIDSAVAPIESNIESHADLNDVREIGEKVAIGSPVVEASPPFSIMADILSGESVINAIRDILTQEDYGVRFEEIAVQLRVGKLFVPKISEFAAVQLAQKLFQYSSLIKLGLSAEIYQGHQERLDATGPDYENVLYQANALADSFDWFREEVKDVLASPTEENQIATSNLPYLEGFEIVRVLSVLTASKLVQVNNEGLELNLGLDLEADILTKELVTKAFKLGAHAVVGIQVELKDSKPQQSGGVVVHMKRLWVSGTAVRIRPLHLAQSTPIA